MLLPSSLVTPDDWSVERERRLRLRSRPELVESVGDDDRHRSVNFPLRAKHVAGTLTVVAGSYAGEAMCGLRRYRLDANSGHLALLDGVSGVAYPAFTTGSSSNGWLYAVNETTQFDQAGPGVAVGQTGRAGQVTALRMNGRGLVRAGAQLSGGELPTHLTMHASGRWLAVSNYGWGPSPGSVAILPIRPDGSLGPVVDRVEHRGHGPVAQRQSRAHVHSTVFDAAGRYLIAADLGADALVTYRFDDLTGQLEGVARVATPPGWGPRYSHWSADGRCLLVVGELACEVGMFAYDAARGLLSLRESVSTLRDADRSGVLAADLHMTLDGHTLYVSNRGRVNTLATFDYHDDELRLRSEISSGGSWPRSFALSPHGDLAVVANEHDNRLDVLRLNASGEVGRRHGQRVAARCILRTN